MFCLTYSTTWQCVAAFRIMNWLAHLFLSQENIEFKVGNLLPDFLHITELEKLPQPFQLGIKCHRAIDIFTDSHPIVKKSISRLPTKYRRFGGILTDVFYDHFLSKDWEKYSSTSLNSFCEQFSNSIENIKEDVPIEIFERIQRLCINRVFEKYATIDGVKEALYRIELKFKRPVDIKTAIFILENEYPIYQLEFDSFFPELQNYVKNL